MQRYNPKDIEPKWQKKWFDDKLYAAVDFDERQKFVMLTEFPYPSGDGVHLGHTREYTLGDVTARFKRMQGYNVLYPMGHDAFGLPTENYAIKNKIAPQVATAKNVANFEEQYKSLGFSFDWDRFINTTDPSYYKWTQWLFLQFFKSGLAYQDDIAINWCPFCKTGLANEEVINGRHERCDTLVEKKQLKQWLLKITKYADRLIDGLQDVDYPSRIADQQVNWINRSKGAEVDFALDGYGDKLTVFTTRPDTLYGATFMVLAPEHQFVDKITTDEQRGHINSYIKAAAAKSEIERQDDTREKTGVFTGAFAVNPVNGSKIPIWIADYVLAGYGTGAIMAVPGHDQRDADFARKYNLPIINVVNPFYVRADVKDKTDFVQKRKVVALVENDKGEILTINWGTELGGRLTIGGTVEDGEDPAVTALREVTEETGYTDLEVNEVGDEAFRYKFFAFSKQQAHDSLVTFVHIRLKSDSRQDQQLDEEEKDNFTVEWVSRQRAEQEIVEPLHRFGIEKFLKGRMYTGEGTMVNSAEYDGKPSSEARDGIVASLASKGLAKEKTQYRLRDWIFSRQHYWGEPIPIIHCEEHGAVAVPDDDLPVVLPDVDHYEPTDSGESPLAAITEWVNTVCPTCSKPAKRETDTMPNWAGSSWYYLRYYDAHNDTAFADRKKLEYWGAVDMYLGGMEHTTLHLLYSRFWHQFFYDQGLVPTPEPYMARRGQGIILAADGSKMSKSKGNVINPTSIIDQGYGADALRLSIAFLAPFDQTTPWSPEGVAGTHRFISRVWALVQSYNESGASERPSDSLIADVHRTTKKVTEDLRDMAYNTAIAAQMSLVNEIYKQKPESLGSDWKELLENVIKLLAPFAPHVAEEMWSQLGNSGSIHTAQWPSYDEALLKADTITLVIQVNGKLRGTIEIDSNATSEETLHAAKVEEKVAAYLENVEIVREIYVPGRLVNFVTK